MMRRHICPSSSRLQRCGQTRSHLGPFQETLASPMHGARQASARRHHPRSDTADSQSAPSPAQRKGSSKRQTPQPCQNDQPMQIPRQAKMSMRRPFGAGSLAQAASLSVEPEAWTPKKSAAASGEEKAPHSCVRRPADATSSPPGLGLVRDRNIGRPGPGTRTTCPPAREPTERRCCHVAQTASGTRGGGSLAELAESALDIVGAQWPVPSPGHPLADDSDDHDARRRLRARSAAPSE
jgi:hypothetical protein